SAVDPRDGSTAWTYGIALCVRDANDPAIIEQVSPTAAVGDFNILGMGIRSFTPTQTNTPISSTTGYPPSVPDAISPAIGYRVETVCGNGPGAPYTELLIGFSRKGTQGGGWRGLEVAYPVHGESHVLHLDRVLLICVPATAD